MIQLENISLTLGGRALFSELTLALASGQRVGLIGPNGAGKSTLLKLIGRTIEPDSGDVIISGSVGYLEQEVSSSDGGSPWKIAAEAFESVRALESSLSEISDQLQDSKHAEHGQLLRTYEELEKEFSLVGGYQYEVEISRVLSGLGFPESLFHEEIKKLSGGWRARAYLARLLLSRPNVLLLDEPTNHLDLNALGWLKGYLLDRPHTFIVVSHDRWFLNQVCTHTWELSEQGVFAIKGNFDAYLDGLEERKQLLANRRKKQAAEMSRLANFIERFGAKASKAKQAKSKAKQLAKLNPIASDVTRRTEEFQIPEPLPVDRLLLSLNQVTFGYTDETIIESTTCHVERGSKIGIIGSNGAGKSTLIKLMLGLNEPDSGQIERSSRLKAFLFHQHQVDALDGELTALDCALSVASKTVTPLEIRSALGAFGISGDDSLKSVAVLSGGEKARVAMVQALVRPVNLLVLDEPTNHLDLAAKERLESVLSSYAGTLIIISHDRQLLNAVCTEVWGIENKTVVRSLGNYDRWLEKNTHLRSSASVEAPTPGGSDKGRRKLRKREEAELRREKAQIIKPLKQKVEALEQTIEAVEGEIDALRAEQLSTEHYADAARVVEVARKITILEARQSELYDEYGRMGDELAELEDRFEA